MSRATIMDMDLSERIREIQAQEGRQMAPINIAGPAGNPTQPGADPAWGKCPTCGYFAGTHAGWCRNCGKAPTPTDDEVEWVCGIKLREPLR